MIAWPDPQTIAKVFGVWLLLAAAFGYVVSGWFRWCRRQDEYEEQRRHDRVN